jgi:hypothetical protein
MCKFGIVGFDGTMEAKKRLDTLTFKVGSLPTIMYIPDFITETEQTMLLNNVTIPSLCYNFLVLFSQRLVSFD